MGSVARKASVASISRRTIDQSYRLYHPAWILPSYHIVARSLAHSSAKKGRTDFWSLKASLGRTRLGHGVWQGAGASGSRAARPKMPRHLSSSCAPGASGAIIVKPCAVLMFIATSLYWHQRCHLAFRCCPPPIVPSEARSRSQPSVFDLWRKLFHEMICVFIVEGVVRFCRLCSFPPANHSRHIRCTTTQQ